MDNKFGKFIGKVGKIAAGFAVLNTAEMPAKAQNNFPDTEDKTAVYNVDSTAKKSITYKEAQDYFNSEYLEIKEKTPIPKDLSESLFYVRYVNGKYAKTVHEDILDDNGKLIGVINKTPKIEDMFETEPGVAYKGEKHWNIKRFLYDPLFVDNDIPIEESRKIAVEELYKYFLVLNKNDRNMSWQKAINFMETEIDPMINSSFYELQKNGQKIKSFMPTDVVYNPSTNETNLLQVVLNVNREVRTGTLKDVKPYTKASAYQAYLDYFMYYRKNTPEEAKKLATETFEKEYQDFQNEKNNPKYLDNKEHEAFYQLLELE